MKTNTLTPEQLQKMDAYWRAANYLSVGQIYLYDNPLRKRPIPAPVEVKAETHTTNVKKIAIVDVLAIIFPPKNGLKDLCCPFFWE